MRHLLRATSNPLGCASQEGLGSVITYLSPCGHNPTAPNLSLATLGPYCWLLGVGLLWIPLMCVPPGNAGGCIPGMKVEMSSVLFPSSPWIDCPETLHGPADSTNTFLRDPGVSRTEHQEEVSLGTHLIPFFPVFPASLPISLSLEFNSSSASGNPA